MTLEELQDKIAMALQSDLENGVKWLNERAARRWEEDYPELSRVITQILLLEKLDD